MGNLNYVDVDLFNPSYANTMFFEKRPLVAMARTVIPCRGIKDLLRKMLAAQGIVTTDTVRKFIMDVMYEDKRSLAKEAEYLLPGLLAAEKSPIQNEAVNLLAHDQEALGMFTQYFLAEVMPTVMRRVKKGKPLRPSDVDYVHEKDMSFVRDYFAKQLCYSWRLFKGAAPTVLHISDDAFRLLESTDIDSQCAEDAFHEMFDEQPVRMIRFSNRTSKVKPSTIDMFAICDEDIVHVGYATKLPGTPTYVSLAAYTAECLYHGGEPSRPDYISSDDTVKSAIDIFSKQAIDFMVKVHVLEKVGKPPIEVGRTRSVKSAGEAIARSGGDVGMLQDESRMLPGLPPDDCCVTYSVVRLSKSYAERRERDTDNDNDGPRGHRDLSGLILHEKQVRGFIRRQHYGKGNGQVKTIFIAPFVNRFWTRSGLHIRKVTT